jgi:hypothetical protein
MLGVYLFPLCLVVSSLSVPPNDLPLCGLMFALGGLGFVLARRESRAWRLIWVAALALSVVCGVMEVVAGQRIARQRSHHESNLANPRSALDARMGLCFHIERHWPGAGESGRSAGAKYSRKDAKTPR